MKSLNEIKLRSLVETSKGIGTVIGVSENSRNEVELEVRIIEGGEEFFVMGSEVTYER